MKLYSIHNGRFKLDGGAMFGVVPKTIWQKTHPADENNLCAWAMRSLLIEDGDMLMLIDTGIGDKQSKKFLRHYYLHGEESLEGSLASHGFGKEDITDVFLTHLHFDHCGGCIAFDSSKERLIPAFPNATYWSNEAHWNSALNPNPRERGSFLEENIRPIQESGQLKYCGEGNFIHPDIDVLLVHGHTDSQMLPRIKIDGKTVVFMADLIPSTAHIPLPYVMAYDLKPLLSIEEKAAFLRLAVDEDYYLFLQHDPVNEICSVMDTEKGVRLRAVSSLVEVFGS